MVVIEKGENGSFNRIIISGPRYIFLKEHSNTAKLILLLTTSVLLLVVSCEDPLDSLVTKKDSNDLFELMYYFKFVKLKVIHVRPSYAAGLQMTVLTLPLLMRKKNF